MISSNKFSALNLATNLKQLRLQYRYTVREKYEPRLWRHLFGIFLLIFLAIRGYCFVIFTKIWRENLLAKGAKQSKAADVRLRRGEARGACSAARARASTKYERADSAFDRVRITPLQYTQQYVASLIGITCQSYQALERFHLFSFFT